MKPFDSFRGLLRNRSIAGTKVLVCAVGSRYADFLKQDTEIYERHYPATTAVTFAGPDELMEAVGRGYDIVHLLCGVGPTGALAESGVTGTALIDRCCASGVKLLWLASDNDPDGYITGFQTGAGHINLVMTIQRSGAKFPNFLGKLLSRLARGDSMPTAWVDLCSQIPGADSDAPEQIYVAGGAGAAEEGRKQPHETATAARAVPAVRRLDLTQVCVPTPAADLCPAILKYKTTYRKGGQTIPGSTITEIRDEGENWLLIERTVSTKHEELDETTVQKGSLVFVKRKHTRGPTQTEVDYTDKKVSGKSVTDGQEKPVSINVDGSVFGGGGMGQIVSRLPLAPGYEVVYRSFSLQRARQVLVGLLVARSERVTVPAGEFDAWLVRYGVAGSGINGTFWIDTAQPRMVKFAMSAPDSGGAMTMELEQ